MDPLTFWTLKLGGESPGPSFSLAGLGSVIARSLLLVGVVAGLKGVIEQLLQLLSKHLPITRHLMTVDGHGPWPHRAYSLGGTDNKYKNIT